MKTLKFKSLIVQCVVSLAVIFSSCDDKSEKPATDPVKREEAEKVLALRHEFDFIQRFVDESLAGMPTEEGRRSTGKIAARIQEVAPCAAATEEELPDGSLKVTMDFGDGCLTESGHTLSGKAILIVNFSEEAVLTFEIQFEDYQELYLENDESARVNGTSAGTILIDLETFLISQSLEQDLTMTYADNTQAEMTSSQVIESDENGIRVPEFNAAGKFANGDVFELYVKKTLRFNFECVESELPVEGIEVLTFNGRQSEINYGNGACDEEYTVR